jgi:hypothetical protein
MSMAYRKSLSGTGAANPTSSSMSLRPMHRDATSMRRMWRCRCRVLMTILGMYGMTWDVGFRSK